MVYNAARFVTAASYASRADAEGQKREERLVRKRRYLDSFSLSNKSEEDFPLYFADSAEDLPFVDLRDWCEILNMIFMDTVGYDDYRVTASVDSEDIGIVTLQRENGSTMTCNFADGEIAFTDYNAFIQDMMWTREWIRHISSWITTNSLTGKH